MCQQKCAVKGCRFLCAEKTCLIVAGMPHTHGCGVHRDMRIEAQAARLENAILDTRDREHLEADRFCNATSSGIDWTNHQQRRRKLMIHRVQQLTRAAWPTFAVLFSLLGVQVQVLGASLLARRTAAVAATGPRGQLAAVLIRLTFDTT